MVKKTYNFCFKEGSRINQVICAVMIYLPVLSYGGAIGWMSPMTLLLQSDASPRGEPLSDLEISWMAAVAYISCVPANYMFAYICDKWGRKAALLLTSSSLILCWIIKLSSMSTYALVCARGLVGVAMAGCYVVTPIYVKEISEVAIRGALGSMVILSQTAGNLILYVIGDLMSYQAILWTCLVLPTFHIFAFLLMPESPAYLVRQGKEKEAARALSWLRCRNVSDVCVQDEMNALKKELEEELDNNKFALMTIVRNKILCRAFRIAMVVSLAREVCGAIPVLNFAGDIFRMASEGSSALVLSPNQQAMMLGAVQVLGSALASSLVETTGRRPLLMVTSFVSGVSMCALASWFLARSLGVLAPSWLPLTALCLCIFCDAAGLQPVSFVVLSELFSFQFRSTVTAVAMSASSFSDIFQMLFFKPIATSIGVYVAFYIFGFVCLLNTVYVILVVPETKMRDLAEIYEDLKTKKEKRAERQQENRICE